MRPHTLFSLILFADGRRSAEPLKKDFQKHGSIPRRQMEVAACPTTHSLSLSPRRKAEGTEKGLSMPFPEGAGLQSQGNGCWRNPRGTPLFQLSLFQGRDTNGTKAAMGSFSGRSVLLRMALPALRWLLAPPGGEIREVLQEKAVQRRFG